MLPGPPTQPSDQAATDSQLLAGGRRPRERPALPDTEEEERGHRTLQRADVARSYTLPATAGAATRCAPVAWSLGDPLRTANPLRHQSPCPAPGPRPYWRRC